MQASEMVVRGEIRCAAIFAMWNDLISEEPYLRTIRPNLTTCLIMKSRDIDNVSYVMMVSCKFASAQSGPELAHVLTQLLKRELRSVLL
jgi:hypothetical protein